jgi:TRAP-type C4-dicarboxylate transport system permease large subunit
MEVGYLIHGTTIGTNAIKAGLPFLACDAVAVGLITAFPALSLYLPNLMK